MRLHPVDNPAWEMHEEVHFFADPASGLRAFVAIFDRGPLGIAGGGVRMMQYVDEDAALEDALRLAAAMGAKMVLSGAPSGGAKCVVMGDPSRDKTPALLAALARAIDGLEGRFVAGADVGTSSEDLRVMARHTPYVDPSSLRRDLATDLTARGVVAAMSAAAGERFGSTDLSGVRVAIQGVGKVGTRVARSLSERGARLTLADVDDARAEALARELGAHAVRAADIVEQEVDVFSPCALGDVVNDESLSRFRCAILVGSANDPLARRDLAEALAHRRILYVPDFVANVGGVMAGAHPRRSATERGRERLAARVGELTRVVLRRAVVEGVTPEQAARRLVAERGAERAANDRKARRVATRRLVTRLWRRGWFARSVLGARVALAG